MYAVCNFHASDLLTLEKRALPSVLHVSKVVSLELELGRSEAEDDVVSEQRLDDEGIDGNLSLH